MTVVLVHVKHRKKIEGRKRKLSPVRHQTCIVPSQNHEPSSELLRFVRSFVSKVSSNRSIFLPHHLGGMTLNQARFHVFNHFFYFLELKCHATPCMCAHALRLICLKIYYIHKTEVKQAITFVHIC